MKQRSSLRPKPETKPDKNTPAAGTLGKLDVIGKNIAGLRKELANLADQRSRDTGRNSR